MSAAETAAKPQNVSELRMVLAHNLESLVATERSVSDCARKLRISRSQLNRFLSGETYPRPDILQRICQQFGTDARILTENLADISNAVVPETMGSMLPDLVVDLDPVSQTVLPDGIYAEWMLSTVEMGLVEMHLFRIYSENGRRLGKVRVSIEATLPGMKRYRYPMVVCGAQYFMQRDGFASIDRVGRQSFHAFTAYRVGYGPATGVYPGYKLSGISHHPKRLFARTACMLERLGNDTKSLLTAARQPEFRRFSDAPPLVQRILKDVQDEQGGWQTP